MGRRPVADRAMTDAERQSQRRARLARAAAAVQEAIAGLDLALLDHDWVKVEGVRDGLVASIGGVTVKR